jgi:hypothetical protein
MTTNAFRSVNEAPRGYNYRFVIDHPDLTQSADNTAQDITLITLPANSVVKATATYLKTPFELVGTTAYNSNTISIGDSGSATRFVNAQQINRNGTEVLANATNTTFAYETATAVVARFASMASYDLAELNAGEIHIFLEVQQLDSLT